MERKPELRFLVFEPKPRGNWDVTCRIVLVDEVEELKAKGCILIGPDPGDEIELGDWYRKARSWFKM